MRTRSKGKGNPPLSVDGTAPNQVDCIVPKPVFVSLIETPLCSTVDDYLGPKPKSDLFVDGNLMSVVATDKLGSGSATPPINTMPSRLKLFTDLPEDANLNAGNVITTEEPEPNAALERRSLSASATRVDLEEGELHVDQDYRYEIVSESPGSVDLKHSAEESADVTSEADLLDPATGLKVLYDSVCENLNVLNGNLIVCDDDQNLLAEKSGADLVLNRSGSHGKQKCTSAVCENASTICSLHGKENCRINYCIDSFLENSMPNQPTPPTPAPSTEGTCKGSIGTETWAIDDQKTEKFCIEEVAEKAENRKTSQKEVIKCVEIADYVESEEAIQINTLQMLEKSETIRFGLICRTFGRKIPFHILHGELRKKWENFGDFTFIHLELDCYLCLFKSEKARIDILQAGPWIVSSQVIGLEFFDPKTQISEKTATTTPVWIRMPGLPLALWTNENLTRIAKRIGEPLWIDKTTLEMEKAKFARVCVKVDFSKRLINQVKIQMPYGI